MKRNMVIGIAVVLALTLALVIATAAFAQGPAGTQDGVRDLAGNGNCAAFVDADGDGVCDNAGKGMGHAWGFVDENGDGVNDNFVDADGDGVCDNAGKGMGYGRAAKGSANGQGAGMMRRGGQGRGMRGSAFVDADGNGICDLLEKQ